MESLIITSKENFSKDNSLQFSPIKLRDDYAKKWNVSPSLNDFVCLTRNGELVNNSLYRIGGLGTPRLGVDNYFMLIKHVEAYYSDEIMKMIRKRHPEDADRKHLEGRWCILDKNGVEKIEFPCFKTPYLVKNSCIYTLDNYYYNIETKELYGRNYGSNIDSTEYLFIDNRYDDDKSKKGVMKINKKDGTWELFP